MSSLVQHEYSHDEDFLYGRLLCSKNRKFSWEDINGRKVDWQPAKQTKAVTNGCSVRDLSIVAGSDVIFFITYGNQPLQNRYSSYLVGPDIELHDE